MRYHVSLSTVSIQIDRLEHVLLLERATTSPDLIPMPLVPDDDDLTEEEVKL